MKPRTITFDFEVYGLKGQSRKSRKSAGREKLDALFDLPTHHQTDIIRGNDLYTDSHEQTAKSYNYASS